MNIYLGIIICLLIAGANTAQQKCHALAISGGGTLGSYEAGVFKGLVNTMDPEECHYDVVSGVSAGALNSFIISLFAPGDEKAAADFLTDKWLNIKRTDIMQDWKHGIIHGLLSESGLFDNEGGVTFLEDIMKGFPKGIQRKLLVAIADANTGDYVVADENNTPHKVAQYVIASAAIPAVLRAMLMDDTVYIDGGILINLNALSAIEKCRDMGFADTDIVVDLILAHEKRIEQKHLEDATTLGILLRYLALDGYIKKMFMVEEEMREYPDVNWRYIVMPTHKLKGDLIPLDFKPEDLAYNILHGEEDGRDAVNNKQDMREVVKKARKEIMDSYFKQATVFNPQS